MVRQHNMPLVDLVALSRQSVSDCLLGANFPIAPTCMLPSGLALDCTLSNLGSAMVLGDTGLSASTLPSRIYTRLASLLGPNGYRLRWTLRSKLLAGIILSCREGFQAIQASIIGTSDRDC